MSEAYTPQRLERWKLPGSYVGAEWSDYYRSGVGQHRDSSCLEQSNFVVMLKALGGESDTVQVVREGHWAVGWVEWIAIHESDTKALREADRQLARLEDYPVLDDDDWSQREWETACDYWECAGWRERVRLLRFRGRVSGFRDLMAAVRGSWSAADLAAIDIGVE